MRAIICTASSGYFPDAVSAERRVARGELDVNTSFQSNRYTMLKKPGYLDKHARAATQLALNYISFNTKEYPALRDRRVRRALSESIVREFITGILMRAGQMPPADDSGQTFLKVPVNGLPRTKE